MKLSEGQSKVIRLMQEGWALGSHLTQIGHTRLIERGVLQKHGLGHGAPMEDVNIRTINALVRKKLITKHPNKLVMVQPTRYSLTEKGKETTVR